MEVLIEGCESAHVYRPSPLRRTFLIGLMVAAYAVVLPFCYNTAGEPRATAIIQAEKLAEERWAKEVARLDAIANGTLTDSGIAAATIPVAANANDASADVSLSEADGGSTLSQAAAGSTNSTSTDSHFDASKIQHRALPPSYLPSAWALLALFATLTLHALFHLLGHWIVKFKAITLYSPAQGPLVDAGCLVLIQPPENRGKAALVPVVKSDITGHYGVEFQRQKYTYTPAVDLSEQDAKEHPNGVFGLSVCPTNLPLSHYKRAKGLLTDAEVGKMKALWGSNHLSVNVPGFFELLGQQLISPLAIFQIFCALLWLLDEYWSYTMWTLVSVLILEGSTVFQRTRTQKMLGGMALSATPIYVYRKEEWQLVQSNDLLPGDIISLQYQKGQSAATEAVPAAVATGTSSSSASSPSASIAAPTAAAAAAAVLGEVVSCDCVLLRGSAVVNEASLTGESVPQMKESLSGEVNHDDDTLDMQGDHRVHILFSGTSLVTVDGHEEDASSRSNAATTSSSSSVPSSSSSAGKGVPAAPDHGAVAYVLRTGFSSSQGSLVQMIEYSQQSVAGDIKEMGLALFILFCFALAAAAYVLSEGLKKGEKTQHELLLKCVIIITSVVPRQFPMQVALAVNMALAALMKNGIFCTEQYRVPLAGKITHCLFDKTGTLTTDQLVPVGIVNRFFGDGSHGKAVKGDAHKSGGGAKEEGPKMVDVAEAGPKATIILAACHSLVAVESAATTTAHAPTGQPQVVAPGAGATLTLAGDPIEVAALAAIEWRWDAKASTAYPGNTATYEAALRVLKAKTAEFTQRDEKLRPANYKEALHAMEQKEVELEKKMRAKSEKAKASYFKSVQIVQRHHFASSLQRMSTVVVCNAGGAGGEEEWFALVKGSPEALLPLYKEGNAPVWYTPKYEALAKKGLRVLALAYRPLTKEEIRQHVGAGGGTQISSSSSSSSSLRQLAMDKPRSWVERDLSFGGFIAFECKIRADSPVVIRALKESDHKVCMVTGDALLTSVHVASEVNICSKGKDKVLTLKAIAPTAGAHEQEAKGQVEANVIKAADKVGVWETSAKETIPLCFSKIPALADGFDLVTTEADFLTVIEETGGEGSEMWQYTGCFQVFARMSPYGKAEIIERVQKQSADHYVLMCGDGGNDVGALKQANVGLALLAGHANANTTESLDKDKDKGEDEKTKEEEKNAGKKGRAVETTKAEDVLNAHEEAIKKRTEEVNTARAEHMKVWQAEYTKRAQEEMNKKMMDLSQRGEYTKVFTLMKDQAFETANAIKMENERFMRAHGQVWDPKMDASAGASGGGGLMDMLGGMDPAAMEQQTGMTVLRPGDASVAAPFTSKVPSVRAVVDLIRQGRCTLLSALMQQQIMMLESIIAAYTLSALSLHNARSSERQMMASSWLIMTAAVAFSYASPLDKMHPLRPLRSLFHPAIFLSILGQALIHIACMNFAVEWATAEMGEGKLSEVREFFRKVKARELTSADMCAEDDWTCQMNAFWAAPFMPNLLNTTVFLVETSQMISVFFANYKGQPWMKGILANHPLFLSVFLCIGGVVVASWEFVPQLNDLIQLCPFPNDAFRYKVVALVTLTIAGTFLWDRLCTILFAPHVFKAMLTSAMETTLKDVLPVLETAAKVAFAVWVLYSGNLLLGIGLWWWYGRAKKAQEEQEKKQAAVTAAANK